MGNVPPRRAHREQRPEQTPNPRHPGGQQSPGLAAGPRGGPLGALGTPHQRHPRGQPPERGSANRVGGAPGGSGCARVAGLLERGCPVSPGQWGARVGRHGEKGGAAPASREPAWGRAATRAAIDPHRPSPPRCSTFQPMSGGGGGGPGSPAGGTAHPAWRAARAALPRRAGLDRTAEEPRSRRAAPRFQHGPPALLLQRGPEPPEPRCGRRRRGKGAGCCAAAVGAPRTCTRSWARSCTYTHACVHTYICTHPHTHAQLH